MYNIGVRLDPSINNVQSFATILFFQLGDGIRVPIARVNNSSHDDGEDGDIHIDRFDRTESADIKEYDHEISGWAGGEQYLTENWEALADRYFDNHGHGLREDGANH